MKVRKYKLSDLSFFEYNIREQDASECYAVSERPIVEHLTLGIRDSKEHFVLADEYDCPIGIGGIIVYDSVNVIWLLSTTLVENKKIEYFKFCKEKLEYFFRKYGILWISVDLRYKRAIKLVKRLGFILHDSNIYYGDNEFAVYKYNGDK